MRIACLSLLALLALGCADPVATRIADARDAGRVPRDLRVTWDDHAAAWGGRRIEVRGDGAVLVTRFRPSMLPASGAPEASLGQESSAGGEVVFRGALDPADLLPLLDLLSELDAWEQRPSRGAAPMDTSRATLRVRVGDAESQVWEYSSDLLTAHRLIRAREALTNLVARARALAVPQPGDVAQPPAAGPAPE
ncbi:MAG: hypothetical protein GXP55_10085 [Deltaproteobacteria bacterium]|nr:hypothetical protein [Deltaproteobacteria bacterium]